MPDERPILNPQLREFAQAVRQLRAVQKSGGKGYKDPTVSARATPLEKQVDAWVVRILGKPRTAGSSE